MSASGLAIRSVALDATRLVLTLADGRVLHEPLQRHIRLEKATPTQRLAWQQVDDGHGLVWPDLWPASAEGLVNVRDIVWDQQLDQALAALQQAGWQVDALPPRTQELVALWRLEADIHNGGFLQFFCNWGEANCRTAIAALETLGATQRLTLVRRMRAVLDRLDGSPEIRRLMDLYTQLDEAEQAELETLDEAYWDCPERLSVLGLRHYGSAPSNSP